MKNKDKQIKRSTLSGRRIENKEVILVDEAIDYVKILGFEVMPIKKYKELENISNSRKLAIQRFILLGLLVFTFISLSSAKLIGENETQNNFFNNTLINQTFINETTNLNVTNQSFFNVTNVTNITNVTIFNQTFINQTQNESDPFWTANISFYFTKNNIAGFGYYNMSNFNISDYYLKSNPFNFINETTIDYLRINETIDNRERTNTTLQMFQAIDNNTFLKISQWNATNSSYLVNYGDTGNGNYTFNGNTTLNGFVTTTNNISINNFINLGNLTNVVPGNSSNLCLSNGRYITMAGTSCLTSSIKFKQNIIPLESVIDRFMNIQPSRYNYIGFSDQHIGLIAEDVGAQFPELLVYEFNNINGKEVKQVQSFNDHDILGLMFKAIQEEETQIRDMNNTINRICSNPLITC